jgi:hypothetical protein
MGEAHRYSRRVDGSGRFRFRRLDGSPERPAQRSGPLTATLWNWPELSRRQHCPQYGKFSFPIDFSCLDVSRRAGDSGRAPSTRRWLVSVAANRNRRRPPVSIYFLMPHVSRKRRHSGLSLPF